MILYVAVLTAARLYAVVNADGNVEEYTDRNSKLSIFQVVKFANSECSGGSRNGTCFTNAECTSIGGASTGSCADGFGVCCIVTITSGQSASVNNTYISASSELTAGAHTYTICPCSDDICRIKFDFIDFTLEGPITIWGTRTLAAAAPNEATAAQIAAAPEIGKCDQDTFQIITPSGRSSPLICGENENQHMIIETCNDQCVTANLGVGASSTVTRTLDIRVTQYRCGDEQAGPPGCLQYFQNTSGKIRSFNFPDTTPGATITYNFATHLANQHYKACIRKGNGKEVICYVPCSSIVGASDGDFEKLTSQPSFGLSASSNAASKSSVETRCSSDYIWIPQGDISTQFTTAISPQDNAPGDGHPNRFCGRYFDSADAEVYTGASVCSYLVPFELGVDFDDDEHCTADDSPVNCEPIIKNESLGGGGGILGFSLCYVQHTPPIA